jgi:subtilisin family serine protease
VKTIFLRPLLAVLLLFFLVLSGCLSSSRWRREPVNKIGPVDVFAPETAFNIREGVDAVSGQLLVRLKPGADPGRVFQAVGRKDIQCYEELELGWYRIAYDPRFDLVAAGRELLQTGQVYIVEPNYLAEISTEPFTEPPNDPYFHLQWGLEKINALAGWKETTGSEEIIIAVLDTGIDHTHPDLDGKVVGGWNFTPDIPGDESDMPGDDHGHGTHVAGIAAARTGNEIGIAGVAPACQLLAVKVLSATGRGDYEGIGKGIMWAVDQGAHVINMSLSGRLYSRFLQEAVEYALGKGVPVVAAVGNEHKYYDNVYPAAYPGVISVGAVKSDKTKADFSTEGGHLFLTAPGQAIYSTVPGGYESWRGTSMATPFVSGAVALFKSKWPDLDWDINMVHAQLKKTAEDLAVPGWDPETGWGLLDLGRALAGDQPQTNDLFGTLVVIVKDNNGEVVKYGRILLREENTPAGRCRDLNTMTNEEGKALFMAQPAGTYRIWAAKDGLRGEGTATVTAGETCEVTVTVR